MGDFRVVILVTLVLKSLASSYDMPDLSRYEDDCSRRKSSNTGRIAGGESAFFDRVGFMASIIGYRVNFQRVFCAGFILTEDTIGTAAYCVFDVEPSEMVVRVGSTTICFGSHILIETVIVNPLYDSKKPEMGGNLALLKTTKNLPDDENIYPISYTPFRYKVPEEGSLITVYGWGMDEPGGVEDDFNPLMKVEIPIISSDQCAVSYFFSVANNEFCAGTILGGKGPCKGDIGGPAIYKDRLVGVLASVRGCGAPASPSIFTDMGHEDSSNFIFDTLNSKKAFISN